MAKHPKKRPGNAVRRKKFTRPRKNKKRKKNSTL